MKFIIILLQLVIVNVFSLSSNDVPTIRIAVNQFDVDEMKESANDFMREIGGVDIQVIAGDLTSSTTDLQQFYMETLKNKNDTFDILACDIIFVGDLAPYLEDLTQHGITKLEIQQHYSSLITSNTVNGRLVALPWFMGLGTLFYRQDLLRKYNYSGPPQTWDELEEMSTYIQFGERKAGIADFYGYAWQGKTYEGLTCNIMEWLVSSDAGSVLDPSGGVTINNKQTVATLNRVKKWINNISPPNVIEMDEGSSWAMFKAKKVAFLRQWGDLYSRTLEEVPSLELGIASVPGSLPGTGVGTTGGFQLAVNKYSTQKDAATKVIQYLTSPAAQKKNQLIHGRVPTISSLFRDQEICSKNNSWVCKLPLRPFPRPSSAATPKYAEVSKALYTAFGTFFRSDNMTAEDVVRKLAQNIETILGKNTPINTVSINNISNSNNNTPMIIGIVVGVGAALVIMGLIGMWWISRRNNKIASGKQNKYAPKEGPLTMIFTDIEKSSDLWAKDSVAMSKALDMHHEIIRSCIQKYEAYEVKTVGDAFFIVVQSPMQAIMMASTIQAKLLTADWPNGILRHPSGVIQLNDNKEIIFNGLRVRIGMHYSNVDIRYDEVQCSYDYYGSAVNEAARIEAAAHGGQIIISGVLYRSLETYNIDQVSEINFLQNASLRGINQVTELYEVVPSGFPKRVFPKPRIDVGENNIAQSLAQGAPANKKVPARRKSISTTASASVIGHTEENLQKTVTHQEQIISQQAEIIRQLNAKIESLTSQQNNNNVVKSSAQLAWT